MARLILPANNPLYPLPADYETLSHEGQRLARVDAVSQWEFVGQVPGAAAAAYNLFDTYYLHDDEEANFLPGFYDDPPLKTPYFHFDFITSLYVNDMTVMCAPRGSAKSTAVLKDILQSMLTRRNNSITYCAPTGRLARKRGETIGFQLRNNRRIFEDFAPEMGGRIVLPRGVVGFSTESMRIANGSLLFTTSTGAAQRGDRPRKYLLDDPEHDPESVNTNMNIAREDVERLIFKIVLPMIQRRGCRLGWTGTKISNRHYLYKAMKATLQADGSYVPEDPRFDLWERISVKAMYVNAATQQQESVWPEMWSVERLAQMRAMMGPHVFMSEMMNEPASATGTYFWIDDKEHGYRLHKPDASLQTAPHQSGTLVSWKDAAGEQRETTMADLLSDARLFITIDSSYTNSATSDYKVVCCMAILPDKTLFVLDMWARRCSEPDLCEAALAMADRWHVPAIWVETIKESFGVFNNLKHRIQMRVKAGGYTHFPVVMPLRPGMQSKPSRISGMSWRFGSPDSGDPTYIRLPLYLRGTLPSWDMLFEQIEDFRPDLEDCGLEHDDCVDAVAMHQTILKSAPALRHGTEPPETPMDMLKRGELIHPDLNVPNIHLIDPSKVTRELMREIGEQAYHAAGALPDERNF